MHMSERFSSMVESGHDLVLPAPLAYGGFVVHALLGKEVEASNSGPNCKVIAQPAGRPIVSLLDTVADVTSLLSQSALLFPSSDTRVSHSDEKFVESDSPPILPKGELSSDGVSCHSLKLCDNQSNEVQSDMFEVHLSDLCQRKFVMFDHSGSKRQIYFHPSAVDEVPALRESFLKITNCKEPIQPARSGNAGHLVSPLLLGDSASLDAMLFPGWRSTPMMNGEEHVFLTSYGADAEGHSPVSTGFLSKENTEDLDALLWSDDEMSSTADSPSDLTLSDADSLNAINGDVGHGACFDKKRKACREAETDSTATSGNAMLKRVFRSSGQNLDGVSGYGNEGFTLFDLSSAKDGSSGASTSTKRQHEVQSAAQMQLVNKIARKEKIQSAFKLLRSILPGGESMDTALVLSEAVQYVKNLQVEVEKLGNGFP